MFDIFRSKGQLDGTRHYVQKLRGEKRDFILVSDPFKALNIAISGAGIGGLSAAIALSINGHSVTVFERASELSEIGAGIQISPNGYHVLKALGVLEALEPHIFYPEAIEMYLGRTGCQIFSLPIQEVSRKRWKAPYIHIHRADLVTVLQAKLADIAPNALRLKNQVIKFENSNAGVFVQLKTGETQNFDLLIGADGIHSKVRAQMHGGDRPRFTGNVAWRATLPVNDFEQQLPPPTAAIWVGDKCHAVTTRIKGGDLVNFVGIVEQKGWEEDGWNIEGDVEEAHQYFGSWKSPIVEILAKTSLIHKWALLDRAPLPFWSKGRVTLLGDAAHPMLPSMAQGAVQAMEDAYVLSGLLSYAPIEHALDIYYQRRIQRVSKIQKGSSDNAHLFHRAHPLKGPITYGPMYIAGKLMPDVIHRRQDWVYGHDVTSDNK